jgi:hypothetical protein
MPPRPLYRTQAGGFCGGFRVQRGCAKPGFAGVLPRDKVTVTDTPQPVPAQGVSDVTVGRHPESAMMVGLLVTGSRALRASKKVCWTLRPPSLERGWTSSYSASSRPSADNDVMFLVTAQGWPIDEDKGLWQPVCQCRKRPSVPEWAGCCRPTGLCA